MGNQRHRDHGDIDGPLRKSQIISAATRERVQGQVKSIVFLSETTRIEQSMRSILSSLPRRSNSTIRLPAYSMLLMMP